MSCSAPSLASLSALAPSVPFLPAPPPPSSTLFFFFFFFFFPNASFSVSSAPPPPPTAAIPSYGAVGVPSGVSALAFGVSSSDTPGYPFPFTGTSGADFEDHCAFHDYDDSSTKEEKDFPTLGKGESSKIFHEVVNLITSFFPHAKLGSPSSLWESFPWLELLTYLNSVILSFF